MTDAEALDQIAQIVALDESGMWTDESGLLENICDTVEATGRSIPNA